MVDVYNEFFTNTQLTAILYSNPQREDLCRETFFADFLLRTDNGTVSFRETLLRRRFAYTNLIAIRNWLNMHLEELVCEILNEQNLLPVPFDDQIDDPALPAVEINELIELKREDIAHLPDFKDNLLVGTFIGAGGVGFEKPSNFILVLIQHFSFHHQFGHVYKATCKSTGNEVVMKHVMLNLEHDSLSTFNATTEVNVLRKLHHDNIVELVNIFIDRKTKISMKSVYLIFHPATEDLYSYIRSQKSLLPEVTVLNFMRMIFSGISYIHASNIIHRDMKPSNILLFPGNVLKICDFGIALQPGDHKLTRCATRNYMAPEMLLESYDYDSKIDIWVNSLLIFPLTVFYAPQVPDLFRKYFF